MAESFIGTIIILSFLHCNLTNLFLTNMATTINYKKWLCLVNGSDSSPKILIFKIINTSPEQPTIPERPIEDLSAFKIYHNFYIQSYFGLQITIQLQKG